MRQVRRETTQASPNYSRWQYAYSGRVASGVGVRSGGVGPPKPVRRPQAGDSGEWATQLERTPAPGDRTRPAARAVFVDEVCYGSVTPGSLRP